MNSMLNCSRLLAAVCGVVLAGCNAVEDVRDPPFTDVPPQKAVLSGTITGLSSARPIVLRWRGTPACQAPSATDPTKFEAADCKFFGIQGAASSNFSFGADEDVGTPYNITVQSQPYGKTCIPRAGTASGTIGGAGPAPVIDCTDNLTAVPRYNLTVTIPTALQSLPNLDISLATEEKLETRDARGQASVMFPGVLFNSGLSLPLFEYKLIATTRTPDGIVNRCTFAPVTGLNLGGENRNPIGTFADGVTDNDIVLPTGAVSVSLSTCTFSVSATVAYNGTPSQAIPAGLTLALRRSAAGMLATQDVQTLTVPAVASGTTTVTFPTPVMANANAVYELVVTAQPAGQTCVVFGNTTTYADTTSTTAGVNTAINAPTASAVMLVDPSNTDWWAYANRSVRCRAIPAPADRLIGTYQMDARTGFQANVTPSLGYGRSREFLTFFADGTFLYGIDATGTASRAAGSPNATWPASLPVRAPANWTASSGVQHGFYAYNSVAGTITFTVVTATNINPVGRGIAAMAGAAGPPTFVPPPPMATNVVKGAVADPAIGIFPGVGSLGTLSMTFASASGTRLWTMTEPSSRPGELTGTWVTADHRRVFVHSAGDSFTYHGGVNGMGNLQDVCMLPTDDSTQSAGSLTAHGGSAAAGFLFTCQLGVVNPCPTGYTCPNAFDRFASTPDIPDAHPKNSPTNPILFVGPTTPRLVPGFIGRFPGTLSQVALGSRPTSPTLFTVEANTLTVRNTLNGVVDQPTVTFTRERTTSPTAP
jgi:hypothetical protein